MKARIRIMGDGIVVREIDDTDVTYDTAMLIQFDSRDDLRAALEAGSCSLTFLDDSGAETVTA